MAREALRIINVWPDLLGGIKQCVLPIFIAQQCRNLVTPTGFARHRRVRRYFIRDEKSFAVFQRFFIGIQLCRVILRNNHHTIGQRFAGVCHRDGQGVRKINRRLLLSA